ncbi:hypothetical protein OAL10_10350 [Gammaproteobacteria bacterium]|jgi:hypothetical protein|nr:hypothetical protein [Gammaproteobacteria bacterium]
MHDLWASGDIGVLDTLFYHAVDAVGIVHALVLSIQPLIMPERMLIFSGH